MPNKKSHTSIIMRENLIKNMNLLIENYNKSLSTKRSLIILKQLQEMIGYLIKLHNIREEQNE